MSFASLRREIPGLVGWLAVSFAAAGLGGFASAGAGSFYQELVRPAWAPPAWLFAPAWTVLYLLMGVASWLIWRERTVREVNTALALFLVQLGVNALWTWLFFAWRLGALAFAEVLVLWVLILCTILAFWRVRPMAGVLLIPYLAWVAYASLLTYAVWQGNPALLG